MRTPAEPVATREVGGFRGRAAHLAAWKTSATMVAIGLVMVSIAVALGG